MTLDPDRLLETRIADRRLSYSAREAILYALCCGADRAAATGDLRFVQEDGLAVIPSFGQNLCFNDDWMVAAGIDMASVVHGGLDLRMARAFDPAAEVTVRSRVAGLVDKGPGKAALILQDSEVLQDGVPIFRSLSNMFVMGGGGFGGSRGEAFEMQRTPDTPPDAVVDLPTRSDSPLLFRLLGDLNPLHIRPEVARAAGFDRPILHGANTFGIVCLDVLRRLAGGDPSRMRRFTARFSGPLYPGETLRLSLWTAEGGRVRFAARCAERDAPVLDGGLADLGVIG